MKLALCFVMGGGIGAIVACFDVRHPLVLTAALSFTVLAAINYAIETLRENE